MKDLVKRKRAQIVLSDPSSKHSFILDDRMVYAARQEKHREERGQKKKKRKDCGLVAFPQSLAEYRQNDFFFLAWTVWFHLVSRLEKEIKKDSRHKQHRTKGEVILSLSYEQRKTFYARFDRWGFVFKIHQPWVAEIFKKEFGLLAEMTFPHPCPLIMYGEIICGHDMIPKK